MNFGATDDTKNIKWSPLWKWIEIQIFIKKYYKDHMPAHGPWRGMTACVRRQDHTAHASPTRGAAEVHNARFLNFLSIPILVHDVIMMILSVYLWPPLSSLNLYLFKSWPSYNDEHDSGASQPGRGSIRWWGRQSQGPSATPCQCVYRLLWPELEVGYMGEIPMVTPADTRWLCSLA